MQPEKDDLLWQQAITTGITKGSIYLLQIELFIDCGNPGAGILGSPSLNDVRYRAQPDSRLCSRC